MRIKDIKVGYFYITDYPITELGDKSNVEAPTRHLIVLENSMDKYITCVVQGEADNTITTKIKAGYIYLTTKGSLDEN